MSVATPRGQTTLQGATWSVQTLNVPPLIAPARQIVLPQNVAGEEEALARGALWVQVHDGQRGALLVQCALGFAGTGVAHGVWPLPERDRFLACAGGYAYDVSIDDPQSSVLLPPRPVVSVLSTGNRTVLVTHHALLVREGGGALWTTARLSWEGVTLETVEGDVLHGTGWDMMSDREVPFTVDLQRRTVEGGGYRR